MKYQPTRPLLTLTLLSALFSNLIAQSPSQVPLSRPIQAHTALNKLSASLKQGITFKNLDSIYNSVKAIKGIHDDQATKIVLDNQSDVCAILKSFDIASISDAFNYQKICYYFDCSGETVVDEEGTEIKAAKLDLSKIEKAAFDPKIDIANLYKAVSILKKAKFINSKSRGDLVENVAKVYEYSGKSLLASAFTINSLIELGGPKLGAKFVAMEANIDLKTQVTNSATEYDNNRLSIVDADVEMSSFILRTLVGLARIQEEKLLTNDEIVKIANFFLTSEDPQNLAQAVQALNALNVDPSPLPKPVSFARTGKFPDFNFKMANVFGQNVDSARFTLKVDGTDQDQNIKAGGDINLAGLDLTPGFYSADVTISGATSYVGVLDSTLTFKFGVSRSGAIKVKSKSLTSVKKGEIEADKNLKNLKSGDKLTAKFDLVDENGSIFEVQQAFVRFFHGDSGLEGFSVAKFKKGAGYSVQLQLASDFKNVLGSQAGDWTAEAFLGDNSLPEPISVNLGKFSIDILGGESDISLKEASQNFYSPDRLIEHTFREPDARPPAFISLVFTAVTLAPLLILFIMWPMYGLNFKLFSFSLSGVVFHVSFTGTLLLYVLYWLKLNMFTTINYLIVLSFFMLFSGHRLLSGLAKARRNEASEKGKKIN